MTVEIIENSDAQSVVNRLLSAIEEHKNIIIIGACSIEYAGRAASTLALGERVVMIKKDNTILVHQSTKGNPVNWQPAPNRIQVRSDGKNLVVESERLRPKERLTITFSSLPVVLIFDLKDEQELQLTGSEEDIKQEIMENPQMIFPDLKIIGEEVPTKFGVIDLLGRRETTNEIVVLELKRRRGSLDDVSQLDRYVRYLQNERKDEKVVGVLVADGVTDNAMELLQLYGHQFREVSPRKIS